MLEPRKDFHGPVVSEDVFWSLVPGRHQGGRFFIAGAWHYGDLVCQICGDGIDIEGLDEARIKAYVRLHPNASHESEHAVKAADKSRRMEKCR